MIAQAPDLIFFLLKFSQVSTQTLPSAHTDFLESIQALLFNLISAWFCAGQISPLLPLLSLTRSSFILHRSLCWREILSSLYFSMSRYASSNAGPQQQQLLTENAWVVWAFVERKKTKPGRSYLGQLSGKGDDDHLFGHYLLPYNYSNIAASIWAL